jgi:Fe-S oxidoreductase
MGVYDAPRQAIGQMGLELVEMPRNRANALCCGTNGWTHCAVANKAIQVHLRCAMQDQLLSDEIAIEIKDLATLVAEALVDGNKE